MLCSDMTGTTTGGGLDASLSTKRISMVGLTSQPWYCALYAQYRDTQVLGF